ncbi:hypothetical protein [Chryseobacterium sp. PMSZPI]|uniref:hypothetical protein n=1 Tax=Chryseobacterium sp. PMSZPI TaxID=1033900 RepID=UPI000C347F8A|nr:hypothetical protein [Chryseobacterium sp. PMSZPI]PKF76225.1 hypothetical protein CW752_00100 [Chryseobacterium sp. PMSZPI]
MRKKIYLWLSSMIVLSFILHSCIRDEVFSSVDPASKEYTSKSLWKEDETYIKNVMKVYFENEGKIKKINGTIYWDYAITVGTYNESFLMVPVVDNGRVTSVLQVPRKKDTIYFYFTDFSNHIAFFQTLLFSKYEKRAYTNDRANPAARDVICTTSWYSVWMPDNEQLPYPETGPGHWETYSVIKCEQRDQEPDTCIGVVGPNGECPGGGGSTSPGGGGGYPYPEDPKPIQETRTPCGKLKTQYANPNFKAKIEELDKSSILNQKKETGYSESKGGVFTALSQAASTDSSDGMKIIVSADTKGYIHTHQNDYENGTDDDGNIKIRQPIRMFSPADVNTLMTMAGYVTDGNYRDLYATMISSYGNYTIIFTGVASDIKTGFDTQTWRDNYKAFVENEKGSLETKFLRFLKEKMNIQSVELYKIKSNGTIQKKTLNSNNKVESNDCP